MPDWFYRTVSQPVLFRLPTVTARDLALGFMGRLARMPLGSLIIDFMGHMRADPRLRCTHQGVEFPTAVGLGPGLDAAAVALPALARFGFGFLEIGPVTLNGCAAGPPLERRIDQEAIWQADPRERLSLAAVAPRLAEASRLGLPLIARLGSAAGASAEQSAEEIAKLVHELAPYVHVFSLLTLRCAVADDWSIERWHTHVRSVLDAAQTARREVFWCVPLDVDAAAAYRFIDTALSVAPAGLLGEGSVGGNTGGRLIGVPARGPALARVRELRQRHGAGLFLIACGGVHEPEDALALRNAGADLVEVDSGLVYSGPGLPKRINDALLFEATRDTAPTPHAAIPGRPVGNDTAWPAEMSWFWTFLMGAGMLFGSVLALAIAATRVVLPYDEAYLGLARDNLAKVNPRLLAFMAHDRVSLAGTMVAIGVMYVGLSLFGIRRGLHWAQIAVFVSAFTGFATFFLFLVRV